MSGLGRIYCVHHRRRTGDRAIRFSLHHDERGADEKEFRLALIGDYCRRSQRVEKIRSFPCALHPASFGTAFDHWAFIQAMQRCRMAELPQVTGDPDGIRVSGQMVCETCGQLYLHHPLDWREVGYDGRPWLHVLCSGQRVKL